MVGEGAGPANAVAAVSDSAAVAVRSAATPRRARRADRDRSLRVEGEKQLDIIERDHNRGVLTMHPPLPHPHALVTISRYFNRPSWMPPGS
jgi:hypothetical protein